MILGEVEHVRHACLRAGERGPAGRRLGVQVDGAHVLQVLGRAIGGAHLDEARVSPEAVPPREVRRVRDDSLTVAASPSRLSAVAMAFPPAQCGAATTTRKEPSVLGLKLTWTDSGLATLA